MGFSISDFSDPLGLHESSGLNDALGFDKGETPLQSLFGLPHVDSLFGADPGSDDFASRTFAEINRKSWANWREKFLPLLQKEAATINNPGYKGQMIGQAMDLASAGQQKANDAFGRDLRETGLTMNPEQQQAYDRKQNLSGTLAMVDAGNRTRRNLEDRDLRLAGGGLGARNEARSGGSLGASLGV